MLRRGRRRGIPRCARRLRLPAPPGQGGRAGRHAALGTVAGQGPESTPGQRGVAEQRGEPCALFRAGRTKPSESTAKSCGGKPNTLRRLNNLATLLSECSSPEKRREAREYIDRAIELFGPRPELLDTEGDDPAGRGKAGAGRRAVQVSRIGPLVGSALLPPPCHGLWQTGATRSSPRCARQARRSKLDRQVLTRLDRERLVEVREETGVVKSDCNTATWCRLPTRRTNGRSTICLTLQCPMRRVGFALAAVAAMTVFSGIWEGRINHRWGRCRPRLPPPNNWRQSPATLATGASNRRGSWTRSPSINCNVPDRLSAPMSRSGRVNKSPLS